MSRIEIRLLAGFRCDKRGCSAELKLAEEEFFAAMDWQNREAADAGWSCWQGGRGLRFEYCPEHGPATDRMRRIW